MFPGLKRWGNIWKDLTGTSLQENHQICKNASQGIWQTSRRAVPDMAARPCRPGNMAAVTNKESHMPLSSFMFKYKHRLWCISGRYFQLSNVNLYLLTFTARLMPRCFSYLKRSFRGRGGGGSQQFSSNFHVGVWDSAVALENTGTELCKAFFFLTKELCKYKQDSHLSPYCCLRNRPVGSNGKLGFQIFNRIKHSFFW